MKIDKKLIKELVDNLKEFNLTELEYQDGQTKIKVSKAAKTIETSKTSSVVSPNKTVLKNSDDSESETSKYLSSYPVKEVTVRLSHARTCAVRRFRRDTVANGESVFILP